MMNPTTRARKCFVTRSYMNVRHDRQHCEQSTYVVRFLVIQQVPKVDDNSNTDSDNGKNAVDL